MDNPNIIEKKPKIIELEEGRNYAWCSCGLSKKENGAFCDGSHRSTSFNPTIFTAEKTGKVALCMCKHTKTPPFCDGSHTKV